MNSKSAVWVGSIVGGTLGSYIPLLWGADMFSFSSIILGAVGAIAGIYFGFKMSN